MGGTDPDCIQGQLDAPIPLSRAAYWEIELQGVTAAGQTIQSSQVWCNDAFCDNAHLHALSYTCVIMSYMLYEDSV